MNHIYKAPKYTKPHVASSFFGMLLLVAGLGAGIVLVTQPQIFKPMASDYSCPSNYDYNKNCTKTFKYKFACDPNRKNYTCSSSTVTYSKCTNTSCGSKTVSMNDTMCSWDSTVCPGGRNKSLCKSTTECIKTYGKGFTCQGPIGSRYCVGS